MSTLGLGAAVFRYILRLEPKYDGIYRFGELSHRLYFKNTRRCTVWSTVARTTRQVGRARLLRAMAADREKSGGGKTASGIAVLVNLHVRILYSDNGGHAT